MKRFAVEVHFDLKGAAPLTSLQVTLRRATIFALFSVICSSSGWAQLATANRNVILRRDPSTSSPALEHLQQGARLAVVDAARDSGFYHVRTEDTKSAGFLPDTSTFQVLYRLQAIPRHRTAVIQVYQVTFITRTVLS